MLENHFCGKEMIQENVAMEGIDRDDEDEQCYFDDDEMVMVEDD